MGGAVGDCGVGGGEDEGLEGRARVGEGGGEDREVTVYGGVEEGVDSFQ